MRPHFASRGLKLALLALAAAAASTAVVAAAAPKAPADAASGLGPTSGMLPRRADDQVIRVQVNAT